MPTDREAIEAFRCTSPKPSGPLHWRKPHPKPYELRIQSGIHGEASKPSTMLLGLDAEGIAAIICWCSVGYQQYKIRAIAVATRHRGQGGRIAQEALTTVLEIIVADADYRDFRELTVYAWIDQRNWPSQSLFRSLKFGKGREVCANMFEWTWGSTIVLEGVKE